MGIDTNMMIEAFHRAFKYNYLKGKNSRRVYNSLVNLLKYSYHTDKRKEHRQAEKTSKLSQEKYSINNW